VIRRILLSFEQLELLRDRRGRRKHQPGHTGPADLRASFYRKRFRELEASLKTAARAVEVLQRNNYVNKFCVGRAAAAARLRKDYEWKRKRKRAAVGALTDLAIGFTRQPNRHLSFAGGEVSLALLQVLCHRCGVTDVEIFGCGVAGVFDLVPNLKALEIPGSRESPTRPLLGRILQGAVCFPQFQITKSGKGICRQIQYVEIRFLLG
jgi:hypothetical protein